MAARPRWYKRWRPRSLQARQLLAASLSLLAFLAAAGYALDQAFADTALSNLRERLKSYATAYANNIDVARDGSLYINNDKPPPDPHFDRPGSGLYAQIVLPSEGWISMSSEGPLPPRGGMLEPRQETFDGPWPMTQIDGSEGEVYRYGIGLAYVRRDKETPVTIYIMEDTRALGAQLRVFRGRVWFNLGGAGLILLVLQAFILQWSLRPLRRGSTNRPRCSAAKRCAWAIAIRASWNRSPTASTPSSRASARTWTASATPWPTWRTA